MSRHIPRHERWQRHGPTEMRSTDGLVVRYLKGAWWADVSYKLRVAGPEGAPSSWEAQADRLGPFKRPRNAMVEAERHVTMLRNRHGEDVTFGNE